MDHARDVASLQQQLALWGPSALGHRSGRRVSHMTSSNDSVFYKPSPYQRLRRILAIDPVEKIAWVEPGVTMEELCTATRAQGLLPAVVPEFRAITVGGAIMGAALESSSFIHGQFNDCCLSYEVLLADATRLEITPSVHSDLFYGLSGSYGSLATLVSAKIHLQPASELIQLEYHLVAGIDALAETLQAANQPDYLDAVILDPERAVVMRGVRAPSLPACPVELSRPWSPWFCQHIIEKIGTSPKTDDLRILDYLFRYDRGAFWMGQFITSKGALWRYLLGWGLSGDRLTDLLHSLFQKAPPTLSPSFFFRALFGWKLSSRDLYRCLHALPKGAFGTTFHVQDFYIPVSQVTLFLQHLFERVKIFPLWLCPVKGTRTPQILSPHYLKNSSEGSGSFDFINVGVYGVPANGRAIPEVTRELEALCDQLGGRKVLYAINYRTQQDFWSTYDKKAYDQLRQHYGAERQLTDLYERTHRGGKTT